MASATSKQAKVTTTESGAFGSKKNVDNYYVTEVTTLGDGSIKRETYRGDSTKDGSLVNKVLIQEATVKDGKETSNTVSSNATPAERRDLNNPNSQLRSSIKQQTADANKTRIKNEADAAAGGLTDAGKKNQEVLGGGSGNNATQPESGDSQAAPPTTNNTKVFENMQYPETIAEGQDVIQFTALSYAAKAITGFSFGGRDRVTVGTTGGRSKGTVTLPIQSGIKDQNTAGWGEDTMNPMEAMLAKSALDLVMDGSTDQIGESGKQIQKDTAAFQKGVGAAVVSSAVGVKNILARTEGKVVNPNLELLFQKPTLRPFSFQFRMSARNANEAKQIIAIIRFFKQNMAPQKGGGSGGESANLFLKAPNTFQVHYLHRGNGGSGEHKFIGKMKECAMTSFDVDYTPDGNYSTYEDGVMTSYTISMSMKELEPVFSEDYDDSVDSIGF